MSVTLTERERLRAEFNRLNSKAWAEVFRTRVEAVQRANPGMSLKPLGTNSSEGKRTRRLSLLPSARRPNSYRRRIRHGHSNAVGTMRRRSIRSWSGV